MVIVRSQNKEVIVKTDFFEYADEWDKVAGRFIVCRSNSCKVKLGYYTTKERALKVLDEIHMLINDSARQQLAAIGNLMDMEKYRSSNVGVFNMPLE